MAEIKNSIEGLEDKVKSLKENKKTNIWKTGDKI